MYEVTLGTAGIMQLGWATAACQFSNEEGVGDSVDSYAYDGKRVQRWNISCKHFQMSTFKPALKVDITISGFLDAPYSKFRMMAGI